MTFFQRYQKVNSLSRLDFYQTTRRLDPFQLLHQRFN